MILKHKVLALGIIPFVLAMLIILIIVKEQSNKLSDEQIKSIRSVILISKKAELKSYALLALNLIQPLYADANSNEEIKSQVLKLLSELSYGSDGYFFVYDNSGKNLMHPRQNNLVGMDLWQMKDPSGVNVVQMLIKASYNKGGGYLSYKWLKPSSGKITDKISYVTRLDKWGWTFGTGFYLDDISFAVYQAEQKSAKTIHLTILSITIVAIVAVIVVFVAGILINWHEHRLASLKLQELAQQIVTFQEEERARVARDLHDGISQTLVSIKLQLELSTYETGEKGKASLEGGIQRLVEAIGEIRKISHDLRPSLLDSFGLFAAVQQLVYEMNVQSTCKYECSSNLSSETDPKLGVGIFRIIQEAVNNIEKHANATRANIDISENHEYLGVIINDDGHGIDLRTSKIPKGIGLLNMQERVAQLKGDFKLKTTKNGTVIMMKFPK